jgi:hypothetical protein
VVANKNIWVRAAARISPVPPFAVTEVIRDTVKSIRGSNPYHMYYLFNPPSVWYNLFNPCCPGTNFNIAPGARECSYPCYLSFPHTLIPLILLYSYTLIILLPYSYPSNYTLIQVRTDALYHYDLSALLSSVLRLNGGIMQGPWGRWMGRMGRWVRKEVSD